MGQTLSEPITAKESTAVQNVDLKVGSSCMQGWRISMEDSHTHILKMSEDPNASFFGVYDGHGGAKIAAHVSKHLHKYIVRRPEYNEGNYKDAIIQGFLECDDAMRTEESLKDEMSGSTAITVLKRGNTIYVNNVGDSRCIASIDGKAEALSVDHKPGDPAEKKRIEDAGGFVDYNRVNGNLALSRALGDFVFKSNADLKPELQIVSGCPEVVVKEIEENWDFLVLACDGIWDVLSNQEVVDFVTRRIAGNMEPEDICEELMTRCLATDCSMGGLGCDNMTVILVCLLQGKPYSRLVEKAKATVKKFDDERREASDKEEEEEAESGKSESAEVNGEPMKESETPK